jgi:hypothetical protein
MPNEKKPTPMWLGHPLLDESHAHELHLASALNEFQGGIPRADAEKRALEEYRHEHHGRAAAHHYGSMRAAHSVGDMDTAQRHHALYSLHVKALGEDPMGPVPEVVRKYHEGAGTDKKQKRVTSFKGHDADQFIVKPISKSESNPTPAELVLKAGTALSSTIQIELGDYLQGLQEPQPPVTADSVVGVPVEETIAESKDPVQTAAANLRKTLEVIALAKAIIAQAQ